MAKTTFSGPVRSLSGFVPAGVGAQQLITADNATLQLRNFPAPAVDAAGNPTGAVLPGHAGVVNIYNSTNGAGAGQLTLPLIQSAAQTDGTDPNQLNTLGASICIIQAFNLANNLVVKPSGADVFTGYVQQVDAAGLTTTFLATPNDTTLTFNGGTTGGDIDTYLCFTQVSAGTWYVNGISFGAAGGAAATPFSA
tara:strand:- start:34 stop:618 length:585 start_codon:yes stop_codon:yes gene_type:complete